MTCMSLLGGGQCLLVHNCAATAIMWGSNSDLYTKQESKQRVSDSAITPDESFELDVHSFRRVKGNCSGGVDDCCEGGDGLERKRRGCRNQ